MVTNIDLFNSRYFTSDELPELWNSADSLNRMVSYNSIIQTMSSKNQFLKNWRQQKTAVKRFFESDEISSSSISKIFDEPKIDGDQRNANESTNLPLDSDCSSEEATHWDSSSDDGDILELDISNGVSSAADKNAPPCKTFEEFFMGTGDLFSSEQQLALRSKVADWASKFRPTRDQANGILHILNTVFPLVPRDVRTLLGTDKSVIVSKKCGGDYSYFGILKVLAANDLLDPQHPVLNVHINVDGLPLYHSKGADFWPILMSVNGSAPVMIALYYGSSKPSNIDEFMSDFIQEYHSLSDGFDHLHVRYTMQLDAVIGDAPARAFMKQTVSHNAYHSCERCIGKGTYCERRVCFDEFSSALRSDEKFAEAGYDDTHQIGLSPFVALIGCITRFPLDYMHLVCLGVMRRLVRFWKAEKTSRCRMSPSEQRVLSDRLTRLHGKLPSEFARQPRSLMESDRWKATEWRQFLLYTGVTVLHGVLSSTHYCHFLCLSIAMSILLNDDDAFRSTHLPYARNLLKSFVRESKDLYGPTFITYNVHSLLHIADDCVTYGVSLNKISAFPYENFLGRLKRLVRNANNPIAQVAKRLSECHVLVGTKSLKTRYTMTLRDGVFTMKNGDICFISGETHVSDELVVKRISKTRLGSLFTIPCDSRVLGIGRIRNSLLAEVPQVMIHKGDIFKKMVCMANDEGNEFALVPVLHQD